MLNIYFGPMPEAIYNTAVYFKNTYSDNWITTPLAAEIIQDVDRSKVIGPQVIESPVLGMITPLQLSGGVTALILMKHFPGKIFNASNCGNNCAKWILELGKQQDFTINLFHVMDFGKGTFDIRILNGKKLVVHNMQEFLTVGGAYLRWEL